MNASASAPPDRPSPGNGNSGMTPQQRKRRRAVFTAASLLVAIVLTELTSYAVLRLFATQPDALSSESGLFDAHRNHRLNPDFVLPGTPPRRLHSADGFRRDTPVPLSRPPRTIRVIALGTSALYGIGASAPYPVHRPLDNSETITAVLEASINQRISASGSDYRVEVINAGVSAYQTFHELMYLNADLLDYQPDIVFNFDGHNDFYQTEMKDRWAQYAYSTSILVDEYNGRTLFLPWITGVRAAAPYSNFFNLIEKANKRLWYLKKVEQPLAHTPFRRFPAPADDLEQRISVIARRTFLRDLWQIHQLGLRQGYDHCVFLQPEVILEEPADLTEHDRHIRQLTLRHLPERADVTTRRIRDLLPELFETEGLPFYDVSTLAPHNADHEDLYLDYCHLTPAGARIVASRIEDVLYPMVTARIAKAESRNDDAPR